jgi:hypothetical protein
MISNIGALQKGKAHRLDAFGLTNAISSVERKKQLNNVPSNFEIYILRSFGFSFLPKKLRKGRDDSRPATSQYPTHALRTYHVDLCQAIYRKEGTKASCAFLISIQILISKLRGGRDDGVHPVPSWFRSRILRQYQLLTK